jgi:epoxyqueuosine reductase
MKPHTSFFHTPFTKKICDYGYTEVLESQTYDKFLIWIQNNFFGSLKYLTDHRKQKRESLRAFWPEAESAMSFLFSYSEENFLLKSLYRIEDVGMGERWNGLKISSYAFGFQGLDYHHALSETLTNIGLFIQEHPSMKNSQIDLGKPFQFQLAMDIHPVLDRDLAYRQGLGFFGKNTMLISKEHGSFTIIGSLVFNRRISHQIRKDLEDLLQVSESQKNFEPNHCGQCTACIDACPTSAIKFVEGQWAIDGKDCLSHYTIEEFKDSAVAPTSKRSQEDSWIFGCDVCQDVCPWNHRVQRKRLHQVGSHKTLWESQGALWKQLVEFFLYRPKSVIQNDLLSMSARAYQKKFLGTSFKRLGKMGILKNLNRVQK